MATLKLKAFGPSGDHAARAVELYSLCYVLHGDCHYEGHARMIEVEHRVSALAAAGATEFSLLMADGAEIATHDDLVHRVGTAAAVVSHKHGV
ncbi:hypothetical protein [Azospirillum sp. sgz301742]